MMIPHLEDTAAVLDHAYASEKWTVTSIPDGGGYKVQGFSTLLLLQETKS
jgi:hypothetical protein